MRAPVLAVSLFAFATYAGGAWAQDVGSRVRVRHDTAEVIGTLVRLDPDSIVVRSDITVYRQGKLVKDEVALPVTGDTRLEVSLARGSNAGKGALIGGGVGLGVAALLGILYAADYEEDSWNFSPEPGLMFLGFSILFVPTGSLIGLAIGSASKWDTWKEMPLDLPSLGDSYEVTEGLVRLGFRVSF